MGKYIERHSFFPLDNRKNQRKTETCRLTLPALDNSLDYLKIPLKFTPNNAPLYFMYPWCQPDDQYITRLIAAIPDQRHTQHTLTDYENGRCIPECLIEKQ